ncbi:T-cell immunoglobulin and mucin domain-containing protein 4-like isoform X2 [Micropterus salmoides]|uniref:T-cell immunoglobulin and mucin domain-containing protein 4-like isoform X2 n=1 Tax=Micropterus salmoides TaxID=27706 RepID=UPI0018EE32C6|nr:T-cell immunoglobulin and mucin domain-containing protein 4-like isoform X2 [Micropterus salmoides]
MRGLCYFFLSILTQVSSSTLKVIGHNVTLPCKYDTQSQSVLSFCWGQETVPMSKCSNTILSSEDGAVQFRQSPRYQLLGRGTDGDMSLTILNAQWSGAGVYGCRVEIPGWFNDYKVNTYLVMEEGNAHENHPGGIMNLLHLKVFCLFQLPWNNMLPMLGHLLLVGHKREDFCRGRHFNISTPQLLRTFMKASRCLSDGQRCENKGVCRFL